MQRLLRLTNDPFVDIGKLVIEAWAEAEGIALADLTDEDLERFIKELTDIYMQPAMGGFLSYVVFANARFANPAQINNPDYDEARREALMGLLKLYKHQSGDPLPEKEEPAYDNEQCIYCAEPAVIRASRMIIPMIGSEDAINFVPAGVPRLPICGHCLLALLAMPLGGLNSEGKMWLVYSHDPELTLLFVRDYFQRNRQTFLLSDLEKVPNYKFAKTFLLEALNEASREMTRTASLTAYRFVSGGQSPSVEVYPLPSNIVEFIRIANSARYRNAWQTVVNSAWHTDEDVQTKSVSGKEQITHQKRNYFYEDLFDLPRYAHRFMKRYLLRAPRKGSRRGNKRFDPRFDYSLSREKAAISWDLTALFLEKVMNMDRERIDAIRTLADNLADYILDTAGGDRLFKRLFYDSRRPSDFRLELLKEANRAAQDVERRKPLAPYDLFISVFFEDDEGGFLKHDWYLAMDLLLIRIVERLHDAHWIEQHPDVVESIEEALTKDEGE